jgi:hypothetical protein
MMMRRLCFGLGALVALGAAPACATDYDLGTIHIAAPWSRATPKGATTGVGYMTITNKGTAPDRLTCVSAEGAAQCQIHTMTMEQGVMRMRPLADGLEIKPGETVELKPNGFHMMLTGLKQPLVEGKTEKATLKFQNAGTIDVEYPIEGIGAMSPPGAATGGQGMKKMDMH